MSSLFANFLFSQFYSPQNSSSFLSHFFISLLFLHFSQSFSASFSTFGISPLISPLILPISPRYFTVGSFSFPSNFPLPSLSVSSLSPRLLPYPPFLPLNIPINFQYSTLSTGQTVSASSSYSTLSLSLFKDAFALAPNPVPIRIIPSTFSISTSFLTLCVHLQVSYQKSRQAFEVINQPMSHNSDPKGQAGHSPSGSQGSTKQAKSRWAVGGVERIWNSIAKRSFSEGRCWRRWRE